MSQLRLSPRNLYLLAMVLLLVTNAFIFANVALNRSGDPDATLVVTERELSLADHSHRENSGVSLVLEWRILPPEGEHKYGRFTPWLDRRKLRELGFSEEELATGDSTGMDFGSSRVLPKPVYVVLEYDGGSYKEMVRRRERQLGEARQDLQENPGDRAAGKALDRARKELEREKKSASRLFAVDAGLDPQVLRQHYTDRSRIVICKGVVAFYYSPSLEGSSGLEAYIESINASSLHVPKPWSKTLADLSYRRSTGDKPRYQVQLVYGSRYEPWVESVEIIR
jgi:hypothetical protein